MSANALKLGRKKTSYFATVPPQAILPIVNGRFESSVKGIYVIGGVTGLPLVKVAANQGASVIAKIKFDDNSTSNDGRLDHVIRCGAGGIVRRDGSATAGAQIRLSGTQQSCQYGPQLSAR